MIFLIIFTLLLLMPAVGSGETVPACTVPIAEDT